MSPPPTPSPWIVDRDSPEVRSRGLTPQRVKALQNRGGLSRIRLSGTRTGVDVHELDAYIAARTDPPVYGPLAGEGDALSRILRELARAWHEDRDSAAQWALIASAEFIEVALWGEQ